MKAKYMVAAGAALIGAGVYYFLRKKKAVISKEPLKESQRHHLTNAFARAKQLAVGR